MSRKKFDRELDEWMDDADALSAKASACLANYRYLEALKQAKHLRERLG